MRFKYFDYLYSSFVSLNPSQHLRHSIRLPNYDYSQAGGYFITICLQNRECLFGEIVNDEMILNDAGQMVYDTWNQIPGRYPGTEVDELPYIVQRFKTLTTHKYMNGVNKYGWQYFQIRLWQRNYYEHVIRDEADLNRIRAYIRANQSRWSSDSENPDNIKKMIST